LKIEELVQAVSEAARSDTMQNMYIKTFLGVHAITCVVAFLIKAANVDTTVSGYSHTHLN